jgi:hypothetical protein
MRTADNEIVTAAMGAMNFWDPHSGAGILQDERSEAADHLAAG